MPRNRLALAIAACCVLASPARAIIHFSDVTKASGIPVTPPGVQMAGGSPAAWFDWNHDGWVDLIIGDNSGPTKLFLNQNGQLPFMEATPSALADLDRVSSIDHLVVTPGLAPAGLTEPTAGLVFITGRSDRGQMAILVPMADGRTLSVPTGSPASYLRLVTHVDLDGDGSHDLVAASLACGAGTLPLNTVFRLDRFPAGYRMPFGAGAGGTAAPTDRTGLVGPGCDAVPMGTDYDGNGHPAVMVAPDLGTWDTPTYVFDDTGRRALPGVYGMGIAAADLNDDDTLDYIVTSSGLDLLWLSSPGGRMVSTTGRVAEWGSDTYRYKWGAATADLDLDGRLEVWITAGFVGRGNDNPMPSDANARDVLLSGGVDIGAEAGVDLVTASRTVSLADYDHDGRLDAFVSGLDAWTLLHNDSDRAGHFLELLMPDEPGARIWVTSCGVTRTREWSGGQVSAHEPLVHVGLGACSEPAAVRIRWPWRGEQRLGPLPIDTRHTVESPGTVWFEPPLVAPGGTVTVRGTLNGAVTVGGVPLVGGRATLTGPMDAGEHRFAVTVDGAPIDLRPRLTVSATPLDVITGLWPMRVGMAATLTCATADGPCAQGGLSVVRGGTASGATLTASDTTLVVTNAGVEVPVPTVAAVTNATSVIIEPKGDVLHVRVAVVDGANTVFGVPSSGGRGESDGSSLVTVEADGQSVSVMEQERPWFVADVPSAAHQLTVRLGSATLFHKEEPASVGPLDVSRSQLWALTPFVHADGQDLIQVAVFLRDASGMALPLSPEYLPKAAGCEPVDVDFTHEFEYLGARVRYARMHAPVQPGPIMVTAGPLSTVVWALDDSSTAGLGAAGSGTAGSGTAGTGVAVDLTTELFKTATGYELVPRDRFGQRVGSGVRLDHPFEYVGLGRYTLASSASTLSVRLDDAVVATWDGVGASTAVAPPPPADGCAAGPRGALRPVGFVALLVVGLVFAGRLRNVRRRSELSANRTQRTSSPSRKSCRAS